MRVIVLGAGFGGLELTASLCEQLGDQIDIVLIDKSEHFTFGFSKLDVMFGRRSAASAQHAYADIVRPCVRFVNAEIVSIDPASRRVETTSGGFDGDVLVIALGAEVRPELTPGLLEVGHEFYSVAGAFALRDVLDTFPGGRVVIGLSGTPFKCPPAPSETALLLHDFLVERQVRERTEITLVMPFGVPIPPSPDASRYLLDAFSDRAIRWMPDRLVKALAVDTKVASLSDGTELPFDLYLGVPIHCVPPVVEAAGLTVSGWVPVDSRTLETRFRAVYAIGDVTSVGTPKAGVFAEGQAAVVAARIAASIRQQPALRTYDGRGVCYLEAGGGQVAKVDVTFAPNEAPTGTMSGPSAGLGADKVEFGSARVRRWFGRQWPGLG